MFHRTAAMPCQGHVADMEYVCSDVCVPQCMFVSQIVKDTGGVFILACNMCDIFLVLMSCVCVCVCVCVCGCVCLCVHFHM